MSSDITGHKFNKLTVAGLPYRNGRKIFVRCICECGREKSFRKDSIKSGKSKSCGFGNGKSRRTHGNSIGYGQSREYAAYHSMIQRCYNRKAQGYHNYGGRDIRVCGHWKDGFENFLSDMGKKPTSQHSIDKDDVNADYCPSNCRWATALEQGNNKRNTIKVLINECSKSITEWSQLLGINRDVLYRRYKKMVQLDLEIL